MADKKAAAPKPAPVSREQIGNVRVTTGFEITPDEHEKLVELCANAGLIHLGIRLGKKEQAILAAARRIFRLQ